MPENKDGKLREQLEVFVNAAVDDMRILPPNVHPNRLMIMAIEVYAFAMGKAFENEMAAIENRIDDATLDAAVDATGKGN